MIDKLARALNDWPQPINKVIDYRIWFIQLREVIVQNRLSPDSLCVSSLPLVVQFSAACL